MAEICNFPNCPEKRKHEHLVKIKCQFPVHMEKIGEKVECHHDPKKGEELCYEHNKESYICKGTHPDCKKYKMSTFCTVCLCSAPSCKNEKLEGMNDCGNHVCHQCNAYKNANDTQCQVCTCKFNGCKDLSTTNFHTCDNHACHGCKNVIRLSNNQFFCESCQCQYGNCFLLKGRNGVCVKHSCSFCKGPLTNMKCPNESCRCKFPLCQKNRVNELACVEHTCKTCSTVGATVVTGHTQMHSTNRPEAEYKPVTNVKDICPEKAKIVLCQSSEKGVVSLKCTKVILHENGFGRTDLCKFCYDENKCVDCYSLQSMVPAIREKKLCTVHGKTVECFNPLCEVTWVSSRIQQFGLCTLCKDTVRVCQTCKVVCPLNAIVFSSKIIMKDNEYSSKLDHCATCVAMDTIRNFKVKDYVVSRSICITWKRMLPAFRLYVSRRVHNSQIDPILAERVIFHHFWILRSTDDTKNTLCNALIDMSLSSTNEIVGKMLETSPRDNMLSLVIYISSLPKDLFFLIMNLI